MATADNSSNRPVSVQGLYHTSIPVNDIAEAVRLYSGVLGMQHLRTIDEPNTEMAFLRMADGNTVIAIRMKNEPPRARPPAEPLDVNGEHTAFKVNSVEDHGRMLEKLAAYGLKPFYQLDRKPAVLPGRESYFQDPNGGHIFEIRAPLPAGD
jgi:catechol 2,3-dioxygenase-like lactoylglutathione lyase family enzyme